MYKYKFAIILPSFDPYKDLFDIFINQFLKCWPDCPYPLVISNMFFDYTTSNESIIVLHNGDHKEFRYRELKAMDYINAKYYLCCEDDRIFTKRVNNKDVEKILDFMEKNDVKYFRTHSSIRKKKPVDQYKGYEHFYHIRNDEPYGICGSSSIFRDDYLRELIENTENEYIYENELLEESYLSKQLYVNNAATDDRNVFHIVHCIEKQKWLRDSKKVIESLGYDLSNNKRDCEGFFQNMLSKTKSFIGIKMPLKYRYKLKKIITKIGIKFITKY